VKTRDEAKPSMGGRKSEAPRRRGPDPDVLDGRVGQPPAEGAGDPTWIVGLQRLAGNRATVALLRQLEETRPSAGSVGSPAGGLMIRRDCEAGHVGPPLSGAPLSSPAAAPAAGDVGAGAMEEKKRRPAALVAAPESKAEGGGLAAPPETKAEGEGGKSLEAVYAEKLAEAFARLKGVNFGGSVNESLYDKRYWDRVDEEIDGVDVAVLELKDDKKLSDAVKALFAKLSKWSVDCAEFGQVARWYALLHTYGADYLDAFRTQSSTGPVIQLRPHASTGIQGLVQFRRDRPGDPMRSSVDDEPVKETVDELLEAAPVGSAVAWTNLNAKPGDPFRNENTTKLGPDLYAAHGFGSQNTFTRAQIEKGLWRMTNPDGDAKQMKKFVFISRIEHFHTRPAGEGPA
jgi:hypothetical protein